MTQKLTKVASLQTHTSNMHLESQLTKAQNTQRVDLLDTCTNIHPPQSEIYTMCNTPKFGPTSGPNCGIIIDKLLIGPLSYNLTEADLNPQGGLRQTLIGCSNNAC